MATIKFKKINFYSSFALASYVIALVLFSRWGSKHAPRNIPTETSTMENSKPSWIMTYLMLAATIVMAVVAVLSYHFQLAVARTFREAFTRQPPRP